MYIVSWHLFQKFFSIYLFSAKLIFMGQYRLHFGYKSEFPYEIRSPMKAKKEKAFPYPANDNTR